MQKLPQSGLRWLTESELSDFQINSTDLDGDDGYIIECDLHYPKRLHGAHHNLPLAPDYIEINQTNLSEYALGALKDCDNKITYKDFKLVTHFHDRIKYVVHGKNLKLYLGLGMKLKKIHRILTFKQDNFIASFIEKCTKARQNAKTKFAMDQYKKVANCVYGKTLQNVREYTKVKIHTSKKSAINASSRPTFKNFSILGSNLIQTVHYIETIVHDKPTSIGFSILELSKHFMYDFFYNKMSNDKEFKMDLGMSDTDSFLFSVTNPDKFWQHMDQYMDYSNYPQDHQKFNDKSKAKLGLFKDELGGKSICKGFIGLRPKCYAMLLESKDTKEINEKKVCKGLGRVAIKNRLRFQQYHDCLHKKVSFRHKFATIQSKKHNVKTVVIQKRALTHFDSKRWLFRCGIHSAPYGSFLINVFENECPIC